MTSDKGKGASAGQKPSDESDDGPSASEAVAEVAKVAGQETAPALTDTLLDVMFSDTVRDRVLQQAEAGLRDLIASTLDSLPGSATYGQLQREVDRAERQLREMLREAVYRIFSGSARAELQEHLEEAARRMAEGDTDQAGDQAVEAVQALLSELLQVLQSHWAHTLRLLLGIAARALEATFTAHLKEAFGSITTHSAEEVEKKVEPFQEKIAAKAEELRERLIETRDTMQKQLAEARDDVQGRLSERGPGAGNGSQRQSRLGTPPSRRPPSGPSRKQMPGKAPGGRPPSITR